MWVKMLGDTQDGFLPNFDICCFVGVRNVMHVFKGRRSRVTHLIIFRQHFEWFDYLILPGYCILLYLFTNENILKRSVERYFSKVNLFHCHA